MVVCLQKSWVAALTSIVLTACQSLGPGDSEPSNKPVAKAVTIEAPAKSAEVVFDPNNPPPGWKLCHRNHCHHEDGRVASYQQVMAAIGATRIVGGEVPKSAPAAPSDVAAAPQDAARTASGLASRVLKKGAGTRKPSATSVVTVHYTGWTTDGQSFDSSVARGEPAQFPLNRVIPGWTEGLQLMVEGEERRLWIPESLAYKGSPGKPAGTLVFDVELLSIR
ncbi:MAG: FKBP-type peptidyl-prolyl cis-trans isomerase [Polyangiaceae bacterium]|nr:FKBP-type peptidyl-prolyl cis-trans isomerase [Polyangiaceae bacterium]